MRSRYRTAGGGGMSFFAFQDIITGTAGFLIVIAVLLALDINIPKGPSSEEDPVPANSHKLKGITAEIAKLKTRVEKLQTAPMDAPDTLKRQISELRDAITAVVAAQMKTNTDQQIPNTTANRDLVIEKQKHITAALEAEEHWAELKRKSSEAASELISLEKSARDAAELLKQAISQDNIIKLIPDDTVSPKKPVVVIVGDNSYEIHTLGGGGGKQAASTPDLKAKLGAMPPSTHFLVLFYKPSSSGSFTFLNQEMRNLGYEIGYDLIAEQTKLEF